MQLCNVRDATHVKVENRIEKIDSTWGIDEHGHLAPPSKGGFGVITESGCRVDMYSAKAYFKEETAPESKRRFVEKGQKMELAFRDVHLGEKFVSRRTKRCFGGVKVGLTKVSSKSTVQALDGPTYIGNAVILTDHAGCLADDAGNILIMRDIEIVEVQR